MILSVLNYDHISYEVLIYVALCFPSVSYSAFLYSATLFSKKFVLPSTSIMFIYSNGYSTLYIPLYPNNVKCLSERNFEDYISISSLIPKISYPLWISKISFMNDIYISIYSSIISSASFYVNFSSQ